MKIPAKVKQCTTHHKACPCREWRYEQMETALQVIHTWASVAVDSSMDYVAVKEIKDIKKKAHKALHCLDEG